MSKKPSAKELITWTEYSLRDLLELRTKRPLTQNKETILPEDKPLDIAQLKEPTLSDELI